MSQPLLSIVIPTRNRDYYCIEAVKYILGLEEDDFELVIQDNSDENDLKEFVLGLNDKRIVYNKIDGRINSVKNMDIALSLAKGEYVTMIGDDDVVLPNIISITRWAKRNDIVAVTPKNNPAFFWNKDEDGAGKLVTQRVLSSWSAESTDAQLKKILRGGIIDYQIYNPPRIYHGIMKRSVLESIFQQVGYYIGGLSPDIYLTVASCFYIDKYIVTNFPFTVMGACIHSTSRGNPRSKIEDTPHLFQRGDYHWEDTIPKYNSSQTIWAETALKSLREHDKEGKYLQLFNRKYFLTVFYLENKDRWNEIKSVMKGERTFYLLSIIKYVSYRFEIYCRAFWKRFLRYRRVYHCQHSWNSVVQIMDKSIIYK